MTVIGEQSLAGGLLDFGGDLDDQKSPLEEWRSFERGIDDDDDAIDGNATVGIPPASVPALAPGAAYALESGAARVGTMSRKSKRTGSIMKRQKVSKGWGCLSCFGRKGAPAPSSSSAGSGASTSAYAILMSKALYFVIALLAITFGVGYAITNYQWKYRTLVENVMVPAGDINMTVADGCVVYITPHSNSTGSSTVSWESFDPDNTEVSGSNLKFFNSRVTISLNPGQVDNLEIHAAGGRSAVFMDDVELRSGNGVLTVKGQDIRLEVNTLKVSAINVDVNDGIVRLHDAHVDVGTKADPSIVVKSGEGDIFVAPNRDLFSYANLEWISPCAYVCLPSGHFVDETQCPDVDETVSTASKTNSTTTSIRKCRGRPCNAYYSGIDLGPTSPSLTGQFLPATKVDLQSSPAGATAVNTIEMALSSKGGTIYLQNQDAFSYEAPDYNFGIYKDYLSEHRLNGDAIDLDVDELLADFLAPDESTGDSTEDTLKLIRLNAMLGNSYFLYSSNKVFAQIKPGLLTILSGGLLNPKLSEIEGRLFPGFCPGPPQSLPTYMKGQIADLLKSRLEMTVDAALVEVSERPLAGKRFGIDINMQDFEGSAEMLGDAIGLTYTAVEIGRSQAVIAVIVLSLILATAIGAGLGTIILSSSKSAVKDFLKNQSLMDRVYKLHGVVTRPQEAQDANEGSDSKQAVDTTLLVSKTKLRMQRLEQLVDEQAESSTVFGSIYKGLGLGRSYYQLAEILINTLKNHRKDSLTEFTKIFMVENASALQVDGIRHLDFCREYEVYCTKHRLIIQNIKDSSEKLQSLGLYKEIVSGALTEVFIRLRFRHSAEALPESSNPGDTSLDLFIDSEIELTPFDSDCIPVSEFRQRYELFIDKHSELVEVPITPRMMQKYSSELIRKKLTYYLAIPNQGSTVSGSFWSWSTAKKVFGWVFFGPHFSLILRVLIHMISTLVIPFPMLLVAVFSQVEAARYKLPQEDTFAIEDIFKGPLPYSFAYPDPQGLEWQNAAIIAGATAFYFLGWIELFQFYMFETGRESLLNKDVHRWGEIGSKVINGLYTVLIRFPFHLLTVIFVVVTLSYFGLLLVWALLGAVVNPYKYLPYAAGAGTLVFATFSRYSNLNKLREKATKRIHFQISRRLERLLEQRVRAFHSEANEDDDENAIDDSERFLDRRSKAEFFKLIESTGLDRSSVNIQGLANGTNAAVNTIAAQLGVEPTITMIIVSLARKNADQLLDAAQELGPKLGLDGSLARSLMNLANSWSKESGRQGIKLFINTVAGAAERNVFFNLDANMDSPFTDASDPAIDLTMGIMPEIAASMLAVTEDNDFDPLVELLNTEKVVRDAFKPVPMQVFSLMQHIFVQDREGVRSSVIRIIERLLISDSCSLQMTPGGKSIPISKFVEHLSSKLGTDSQLAAVLNKIASMTPEMATTSALQPKAGRQNTGISLSARDKHMIKVLKGAWVPLGRDEIRRPVQSTKRWLRSKIVASDGKLIVGPDGTMTTDTMNFVLVYQVLCLVDGISAIWLQRPDDVRTCVHFCKETLSLEPDIAGAILALIGSEEGGINPADSLSSTQTMRERIITPITKQISLDVGSKAIAGVVTTEPELMKPQISQILSACFALSRGRRIDFTQLAVLAGLSHESANYVGPLLNGKIKAPLWKQVTPLCNTLGIGDSKIIIALMQLRRQAAMGDYGVSTDTLLPWLGVLPRGMKTFRWLVQLAVAQRPAHIQRALVSVFGVPRSAEMRKFSMIMARRRRLNIPSESIWYESESRETCDPRDADTIEEELDDAELDDMNDWIQSKVDIANPRLIWYLTRHYEGPSNAFDIAEVKREFFYFVGQQHPEDPVDEAVTSKVFDFITFFMTFGEDTPSTKSLSMIFKIKIDLLKAVMQLPLYAADMPVRTLRRPRATQRIEKGIDLLKDYLRVPPEIAYKYNETLSRARMDVAATFILSHLQQRNTESCLITS